MLHNPKSASLYNRFAIVMQLPRNHCSSIAQSLRHGFQSLPNRCAIASNYCPIAAPSLPITAKSLRHRFRSMPNRCTTLHNQYNC
jgi:hypothetical protein